MRYVQLIFLLVLPMDALAQDSDEIDCTDPANAEFCLQLPDPTATNLVPIVAPVAGLLAAAAVAGGGSTATSATSTSATGGN